MFTIALLVVHAASLATPPNPIAMSLTTTQSRAVAAGAAGIGADVAAAVGLSATEYQSLTDELRSRDIASALLTASNATSGGGSTGARGATRTEPPNRLALIERVRHRIVLDACAAAGIDASAIAVAQRAVLSGLPATWGVACPSRTEARLAAQALKEERRALRLGRTLGDDAAGRLARIRSSSGVREAEARVQSRAANLRAVVGE